MIGVNLGQLVALFDIENLNAFLCQDIFTQLIHQLEQRLGIQLIDKNISISFTDECRDSLINQNNIYSCFASREYVNNRVTLTFFQSKTHAISIPESPPVLYCHIFPYLVLRELYNCFIPIKVRYYESLQYALFLIIYFNAQSLNFPHLDEWQRFVFAYCPKTNIDALVSWNVRDQQLYYLQVYGDIVIIEFFNFIQKNANVLNPHESFGEILFQIPEKYTLLQFLNNPSLYETCKCILDIYRNSKSYQYLSDFKLEFSNKKRQLGNSYSTQDQREFDRNLDLIRNTELSFGYSLTWKTIGLIICLAEVQFHPLIPIYEVENLFRDFNFVYLRRICFEGLGCEIYLGFLLPNQYEKDLKGFFTFLYEKGYVAKYRLNKVIATTDQINLNSFYLIKTLNNLINPNSPKYNPQYKISQFRIIFHEKEAIPFSLIDLQLISQKYSGFASLYERLSTSKERLSKLNSELQKEIQKKIQQYDNLKAIFGQIRAKPDLIRYFKRTITQNIYHGFFYIRKLFSDLESGVKSINKHILQLDKEQISEIEKARIIEKIKKFQVSSQLQDNLVYTNKRFNKIFQKQMLKISSKSSFRDFQMYVTLCNSLLEACFALFFFDLKGILRILDDDSIFEQVFNNDQQQIRQYYFPLMNFTFTDKYINERLVYYLTMDPPLLTPRLSGLPVSFRFRYFIFIKDSNESYHKSLKYFNYLPFGTLSQLKEVGSQDSSLFMWADLPELTPREQLQFISCLYHLLDTNLVSVKIYQGYRYISNIMSYRDYYSFQRNLTTGEECGTVKYSPNFFPNLRLLVREHLGGGYDPLPTVSRSDISIFLSSKIDTLQLIQNIEQRISREEKALSTFDLENTELNWTREYKGAHQFLLKHRKDLLERIEKLFHETRNLEDIDKILVEEAFKLYVSAVKFLPNLGQFGLGQYFLYLYPFNLSYIPITDLSKEGLDYKLLLGNTFQRIWHTTTIDTAFPLLIQYLSPFDNWYAGYLNWLVKSKHAIREYCMVMVKSVYYNFHLERNLEYSSSGVYWEYLQIDRRFQDYAQKVLFDDTYSPKFPNIYECKIGSIPKKGILGQDSPEFKALTQIYSWDSLEFISENPRNSYPFLKKTVLNSISTLLDKNLIFPYLELKHTQLDYEYIILIPNLTQEQYNTLFKIFLFFNRSVLYKIEGELFISGLEKIIKFETGMLIKLYLPNTRIPETSSFNMSEILFSLIKTFKLLNVEHYMIMDNLVEGTEFLKNVFKQENEQYLSMKDNFNPILYGMESGLEFMNAYNPLTNILWSEFARKWIVEKQFDQEFTPIYPKLFKE